MRKAILGKIISGCITPLLAVAAIVLSTPAAAIDAREAIRLCDKRGELAV